MYVHYFKILKYKAGLNFKFTTLCTVMHTLELILYPWHIFIMSLYIFIFGRRLIDGKDQLGVLKSHTGCS